MKTMIKLFGFAVVIAVIVFCFMSCSIFDIGRHTPTESNFYIDKLDQIKGCVVQVLITPKEKFSQMGQVIIYYEGSKTLPTETGSYKVTFDVKANNYCNEAKGLQAGTLKIREAETLNDYIDVLFVLPDQNTKDDPYTIKLRKGNIDNNLLKKISKYFILDLSESDLTSIPDGTFNNCDKLVGIIIPEKIASIGSGAFINCTNLDTMEFTGNNPAYCLSDGIMYNKDKTTLILCLLKNTNVNIPNSVTRIGDNAFYGYSKADYINIPEGVTSIGNRAFYNITFSSIDIPASVKVIGEEAFYGSPYQSITYITIGENVSLGYNAFGYGFSGVYSNYGRAAGAYQLTRLSGSSTYTWVKER